MDTTAEMKLVGSNQPIHDAWAKAAGKAEYAGDMQLPGMLHAAVLFSAIPHGYVKSIDITRAKELPGVVDIIHCFNTTDRPFNRFRTMKGQETPEQDRVFNSHVRYVGDKIGCVIAETPQTAREAVKLINVVYEELPFTTDVREAAAGKIDNIHEEGAVLCPVSVEMGSRDEMQNDLVETVTQLYLPRLSHMTMEPHACVAYYNKHMDELTVWSPNQSVHGIRTVVADLFDYPYERLRVVKTTMGGSFGGKQEWVLEPVAVAATLRVARPVKLVYNRGEAMVSTISRGPIHSTFTSRATKDGRLQSLGADVTLDTGAYLGNGGGYIVAIASKFFRCYAYPYAHYTAKAVCTNSPMSGAYRGWSGPEMAAMMEHNLNTMARNLDMDPLEFRLRNVALPGMTDKKSGQPLGEIRIKESIELGRDKFAWYKKKEQNKAFNRANSRYQRGIGIGCGGHVNGYFPRFPDYAGVDMRLTESGGVMVHITLHDHGCGTVTALRMIVAEALELPMERIIIGEGDTRHTPHDVGCFASRTTYVLGRAARDCALLLKERILEHAAELYEADRTALVAEEGVVRSQVDSSLYHTFAQIATESLLRMQSEIWVKHQFRADSNPGVTGAHFAHVQVDTLTGMVKILEYLAVHDIGQAINREMCIGQIQGAVAMGCGAALSEHIDVSAKNGRPKASMKDYHVFNAPDLPHIQVELIEDGQTEGPYGAKSIGEVCYVPVLPTVAAAVNDALNSELSSYPLTPDKIVDLMIERREKSS